jgi:hypothetical protein|nr:MAG TPA: Protein of unknown function (DUF1642) [Caudoviricetes sp.]
MNKQELIERYLKMVKLKDIIKRINELEPSAKQYWIDEILKELGSDYGRLKYRSGYEQGKLEGMVEREKVKLPQCVADWIRKCKTFKPFAVSLSFALQPSVWEANRLSNECINWLLDANNQDLFARAWLDGYEVKEEKRYLVKVKGMSEENTYLTFRFGHTWMLSNFEECEEFRLHHTRKQLEEADFGWVFDCPGIEIEEVE